ncbi:MAG: haloacid dehalogenase-like hydrolase [Gammaproteobacteria bacterium]|nr:haloacid dehalogenase-like hydrolase [Gammaproteobacteria bacterium]
MKLWHKLLVTAMALCVMPAAMANSEQPPAELAHWPAAAAVQIKQFVKKHRHTGDYAVFDADNTTYRYDLEESLLPYLEMKGVLTRDNMDQTLKLIPFKDLNGKKETLNSYYYRLCEIDDMVCYPWVAQIFSGFSLEQLKGYVDELMAYSQPIPIEYFDGDKYVQGTVNRPVLYRGQQELYNYLMKNGIEVYVMSAAHEELVRMVLADPKYGYNVKPQNVIGVTTMLKDPTTQALTTARLQIGKGQYDPAANAKLVVTPYLWTPNTWMAGKFAAILTYIDRWKMPILVAGDTPSSDGYMLFNAVDAKNGYLRVWVNRKAKYMTQIQQMRQDFAARQKELKQHVTADKNWIDVVPADIQ